MLKSSSIAVRHNGEAINLSALVRDSGEEWIVCLHGLMSDKGCFREMLELLDFKGYSAASLDLVGFGNSQAPNGFSFDLFEQAVIVEHAIDQMGMESIHLIGHSMGGMICTLLLERMGKRIKSFINMEGNLSEPDIGLSKGIVSRQRVEFNGSDAAYYSAKSIVEWSKSGKLLNAFMDAKQRRLYLYGEKSREKTRQLEGKIQLAEIPNSGHFMLRDNPHQVYASIGHFLANL
ncbi:MAG TPA: alpha/beta hydrolase [Candidatus Nanoarchaeia archaeon]|nr:alpha/beta hydrolase [Candidatus Nanoarchaeia archaeon]